MIAEILALLIPITAIISFSPIGKALAQAILFNSGASSSSPPTSKLLELEQRIRENEEELNKLREIVIFNDKRNLNSSNNNSVNSHLQANQSYINLEKNL